MSALRAPKSVSPDTSLRDAADLLVGDSDVLEVEIGDRVFVLSERPKLPAPPPVRPLERTKPPGKGLAAFVGIWDDLDFDVEGFKRYIYEMRGYSYDDETVPEDHSTDAK